MGFLNPILDYIYMWTKKTETVSNWQGGIFNQCIDDNIASYVS